MLGLAKGELKIERYNPIWTKLFLEEKENLLSLIGEFIIAIEHVGSTSIKGLDAKPVIDIAVGVDNLEIVQKCIKPLENTGIYVYKGINGVPGRELFAKYNGKKGTHHIHFEEIHKVNWQNHIIFRDYLRDHDKIKKEYQNLKYSLLESGVPRVKYTESKADFILNVIKKAKKEGYYA
jgi:GrpB-like predicted nucleotidyltransferase (UPF0157 family)